MKNTAVVCQAAGGAKPPKSVCLHAVCKVRDYSANSLHFSDKSSFSTSFSAHQSAHGLVFCLVLTTYKLTKCLKISKSQIPKLKFILNSKSLQNKLI